MDAADRRIDDWQAGLDERLERARSVAGTLHALTGTARSVNGLVTVTVDSAGALLGLDLHDDVSGRPARWIAEQILATTRAARADLVRRADRFAPDNPAMVAAFTARLRG